MNFLVAQLGARMHYAIPRILQDEGMLSSFYTDISAVQGWPKLLRYLPHVFRNGGVKRLAGRVPDRSIPLTKIRSFTNFGWQYHVRRSRATSPSEITAVSLWAGRQFCELILTEGFKSADSVYTFNSAGLEILKEAKQRGLRTIMEQTIAPCSIETELLKKERHKFPYWEAYNDNNLYLNDFIAREQEEWENSDVIMCGSKFVADGISACGGPIEKCKIVPYGVDHSFSKILKTAHNGPIRVLTVGAIGLRKGSPYVLQAAAALKGKAEFRMVGGIHVPTQVRNELSNVVQLTGIVPRTEIAKHFAWADVFLLPSICEGSATATYEALMSGLAVITTPNAGSIVRNNIDGYIVRVGEAEEIIEAIKGYYFNRDLLASHQAAAYSGNARADISAYKINFLKALDVL